MDGTTVLLTTQYLDEADRLANTIAVIDHGRLIAQGTSDELKDRIGGERLEVHLDEGADPALAISVLAAMADGTPSARERIVSVSLRARQGAIVEAVRLLSEAGVGVDDLALRRPTLDDVFLTLTGHAAEPSAPGAGADDGEADEDKGGRRDRRRGGRRDRLKSDLDGASESIEAHPPGGEKR